MEPERHVSHTNTHVERDRRGSGMAFVVGGLVVAVAVIALVVWGGFFGTWPGDDADIEVSTQTEVPGAAPAEPVENEIEIEREATQPAPAPAEEAAPAEQSVPAAPAAPAQN